MKCMHQEQGSQMPALVPLAYRHAPKQCNPNRTPRWQLLSKLVRQTLIQNRECRECVEASDGLSILRQNIRNCRSTLAILRYLFLQVSVKRFNPATEVFPSMDRVEGFNLITGRKLKALHLSSSRL